jgi:hypothetical protein
VTVQELAVQLTPFDENEQADTGSSRAPASSVAAIRGAVDVEDMPRA